MRFDAQNLDTLQASLTELSADWRDATSVRVIATLRSLPSKTSYTRNDLKTLFDSNFADGVTVARLFLGLSRDAFETKLAEVLPQGGGVGKYRSEPEPFLAALESLGLLEAMTEVVNTPMVWSDLLIERLRSGRGRAVSGMARGRSLEDFVEGLVKRVFTEFDVRCSFSGKDRAEQAKADFAIPAKSDPRIVIEAKGYAATGSKQTDVLGDLNAIIRTKRSDTVLLFVTDGLTWRRRQSDLKKIIKLQNDGDVARIYTRAMAQDLEDDLHRLRQEYGLR